MWRRVFQADIFPGLAGIDRFENARAVGGVAAEGRFARSDVNHIVVGRRDRDGANG